STIDSIRSELQAADLPHEIIIIDGGSTDGTIRWLARQKDVISIIQHNRGKWKGQSLRRRSWGYFMNLGFKCAQGKYICMLSDDCLVVPGSLKNGFNSFETLLDQGRNVAALAFYWRDWPLAQDYAVAVAFGTRISINHGMFLREALEKVNWIDEENYQFYFADTDLCLRFWERGYEVVDCRDAFVEHFAEAKLGTGKKTIERDRMDREAYLRRWSNVFPSLQEPDHFDWLHQPYHDPYDTAKHFPYRQAFVARLRNMARKVLKVILRPGGAGIPPRQTQ
ncbi:MAG: glycosyltransferase, partial [Chloroflexi bacterium]|nr:glycosyltransferase [Chloroflexota bacterium]